jgi:hypothetical protein
MSLRPKADWHTELRKGNIPNHITFTFLASSENVGTSYSTVWNRTSAPEYTFPAAAATMTISSSSANDTSAGTGARYVLIDYLDENYVDTQQTAILNGQTAVTLSGTPLRINNVRVVYAGSGTTNAGAIYIGTGSVTSGVPANIYGYIAIGDGMARTGIYTVPANKEVLFETITLTQYATKPSDIVLEVMPFGTNSWLQTSKYNLYQGVVFQGNLVSRPIPAKTDIRWRAKVDTGSGDVSVGVGCIQCLANENNLRYP